MARRIQHTVPDEGVAGRKRLPKGKRLEISERLKGCYQQRNFTQQSFGERIGVARSTVDGWFGGDPHSPELLHLVRMVDELNFSPTFLLTGQGSDHTGADRPLADLGTALRQYLTTEVWWHCSTDEKAAALELVPQGQKLLDDFVEHYWTTVIAPALNRMQLAEALEISQRLHNQEERVKNWKPSGSRVRDAMSHPRNEVSADDVRKLTAIAERSIGPRPFRTREKRKLRRPVKPAPSD